MEITREYQDAIKLFGERQIDVPLVFMPLIITAKKFEEALKDRLELYQKVAAKKRVKQVEEDLKEIDIPIKVSNRNLRELIDLEKDLKKKLKAVQRLIRAEQYMREVFK